MNTDEAEVQQPTWLPTLQTGQRVRVRLSSECQFEQTHISDHGKYDGPLYTYLVPHQPEEDGATGRITTHYIGNEHPWMQQHWYLVSLDEPIRSAVCGDPQTVFQYCLQELDPISNGVCTDPL
jgi:hypothetical protein